MGLIIICLIFMLDILVVWQIIRSALPSSRMFLYLTIVLLLPVIGVTLYYLIELIIPKLKPRKVKS